MSCETQGLRKVESSMLKECAKEKARKMLHSKCRSERRKVRSLPSLHFFFSLCVCVFVFSLEEEDAKRKHLKRKGKSRRAKAGAKSERAEQDLEGKFVPFFGLKKNRC